MRKKPGEHNANWVGLVAAAGIVGAGVVAHNMKDGLEPNPDFKNIPASNIKPLREDRHFFGVGEAEKFAELENVHLKLYPTQLIDNGSLRFMHFFKSGILPLREEGGVVYGEIKIGVEGVGELIIPDKSPLEYAENALLDFLKENRAILRITPTNMDKLMRGETLIEQSRER